MYTADYIDEIGFVYLGIDSELSQHHSGKIALRITPALVARLSEFILHQRWLLMGVLAIAVIGLETYEHLVEFPTTNSPSHHFIREVVLLVAALPLLGGIALTLVSRAQGARMQVEWQGQLSKQLARIENWDELADLLVRLPQSLLPVTSSSLFLFNPVQGHFELATQRSGGQTFAPIAHDAPKDRRAVTSWFRYRPAETAVPLLPMVAEQSGAFYCRTCALARSSSARSLAPCYRCQGDAKPDQLNGYCMPLVQGEQPIALLHFSLPPGVSPTAEQVHFLNNIAPAVALAVEALRPQRAASIQAEATEAERRRIAKELHDSLAQNLAYLRLRLDQMTGDDAIEEIVAVRHQLEQMRDVANQAYQQVRDTLTTLRPGKGADLRAAMLDYIRSLGEQVNFKIYLISDGQSYALPPEVERQVLFITQEALANVAKHARATSVNIRLNWSVDGLMIEVADDGQGFKSQSVPDGHFGLSIMEERAQEIGAQLIITSRVGQGTRLLLSVPAGMRGRMQRTC
jgi:signal transduction histidine kinase